MFRGLYTFAVWGQAALNKFLQQGLNGRGRDLPSPADDGLAAGRTVTWATALLLLLVFQIALGGSHNLLALTAAILRVTHGIDAGDGAANLLAVVSLGLRTSR
jgi:hypothetical protein